MLNTCEETNLFKMKYKLEYLSNYLKVESFIVIPFQTQDQGFTEIYMKKQQNC